MLNTVLRVVGGLSPAPRAYGATALYGAARHRASWLGLAVTIAGAGWGGLGWLVSWRSDGVTGGWLIKVARRLCAQQSVVTDPTDGS